MNSVALPTAASRARPAWRVAFEIFKPRIALEIMLAGVAGVAISGGDGLIWWQLAVLAASIFVAAGSAGALNHLAERDLDARMSRTRSRPFVTGSLEFGARWYALVAALLLLAVCAAGLSTNWLAASFVFLGAFTYGVVYTLWLKRRTWMNIVIGGLAGSFAVLAGAAAIDPTPGPAAWTFAVVLFLWTPPHFWSLATYYRQDYADAGVPMLPVVYGDRVAARAILGHTLPLVALSLLPVVWGAGPFYFACAAAGGGYFIWRAYLLSRNQTPSNAIRSFLASLLQLGLLLLGTIVEGAVRGSLVQF
ncbi:MAG: heme o synthase [Steroidobacteraceae bacterium]|nr:heme o synthase [Steroidobacteraceae bacterium]